MRFEVDTNQVGQAVRTMNELISNISNQRKKMMDAINTMNGMWTGSAHDAFLAQFHRDDQYMINLIKELHQVSNQYSDARTSYESCENSAVQTIAAIHV